MIAALKKTAGLLDRTKKLFGPSKARKAERTIIDNSRSYLDRHPVGGYAKLDAHEPSQKLNAYGFLKKLIK